jgi:hypothetical protein
VRYAWDVVGRRRQMQAGRLAMLAKTVWRGHGREIWLISEGRGVNGTALFRFPTTGAPGGWAAGPAHTCTTAIAVMTRTYRNVKMRLVTLQSKSKTYLCLGPSLTRRQTLWWPKT